ncbi:hypothetical protein MHYP_G00106350 [Metynnis hypsauchen]
MVPKPGKAVMMDKDQGNRRSTRQRRLPGYLQRYRVESVSFGHSQESSTANPRPSATHPEPGSRDFIDPSPLAQQSQLTELQEEVLYLNPSSYSPKVLLKIVNVILSYRGQSCHAYALLDDGSERTMILSQAVHTLQLEGTPEVLELHTIRQGIEQIQGSSVTFNIAAADNPSEQYVIKGAFTSSHLALTEHSYPMNYFRRYYQHLEGLPLPDFEKVMPMLLIGADNTHLITAIEEVRVGPPGTPVAIHTRLGWTLQGPTYLHKVKSKTHCMHVSTYSPAELMHNVEKLWQVDVLPYQNEQEVTRSKQDMRALAMLNEKSQIVKMDGIQRHATPLLWKDEMPTIKSGKEAVFPLLRSTERRLQNNPCLTAIYAKEINRLKNLKYISLVPPEQEVQSNASWYIPHHLIEHNQKYRIVFNFSFSHKDYILNEQLLPGPILGPTLIGVLIRFREHPVAISGDIKAMFHQIRLLPEDRAFTRFLWREKMTDAPSTYEWQIPYSNPGNNGKQNYPVCITFGFQDGMEHMIK